MPFNCSSPEFLSHHKPRKNRVSPVSRASPAHINSPLAGTTGPSYDPFQKKSDNKFLVRLRGEYNVLV